MRRQRYRRVKYVIVLVALLVLGGIAVQALDYQTATAYTEKQKQQAKAWLSAHGYAPTRSGAAQAYADYKSGKLKVGNNSTEYVDAGQKQKKATKSKKKEKQNKKSDSKKQQENSSKTNQDKTQKRTAMNEAVETSVPVVSGSATTQKKEERKSSQVSSSTSELENNGDNILTKSIVIIGAVLFMGIVVGTIVYRRKMRL